MSGASASVKSSVVPTVRLNVFVFTAVPDAATTITVYEFDVISPEAVIVAVEYKGVFDEVSPVMGEGLKSTVSVPDKGAGITDEESDTVSAPLPPESHPSVATV